MVRKVVKPATTSVLTVVPRPRRPKNLSSMRGRALKLHGELTTPDPRLVDEPGQVVEVDAADRNDLVGDIAAEGCDFVLALIPGVTHSQAALQKRLARELRGAVQEVVDLAAVGPVGVPVELAACQRDTVTQRGVRHPLG